MTTTAANTHDAVEPLLGELALGTIDPRLAEVAHAHVADCAACRVELDELSAAVAELERASGPAAIEPGPADRAALLLAASRTPQHVPTATPRRRAGARRGVGAWIVAAGTSAACVVLAVLVAGARDDARSLQRSLDAARGDQVPVLKGASIDSLDIDGPFGGTRADVVLKRDAGIVTFRDVPAPPEGEAWHVWATDGDSRIASLGTIDGARELAILAIDGIDADDVARIVVTTEPVEDTDAAPELGEPVAEGTVST
jgi:hypothetical protein